MNLNGKQIISIVGAVVSVLMISATQLTDLFGAGVAKTVVSVAGLINLTLQSVMAALTSQGATMQAVLDMPGVEKVTVNKQANATMATMAVDPMQDKISPTPAAQSTVEETAARAA